MLGKLRNRIHIQNVKKDLEPDEWRAFTPARKIVAEKVLERVLGILASEHPRGDHVAGYVSNFELPWNQHFSN
jgi:hypothetical protein